MRRRDFLTWMGMGLAGATGASSRCQTRSGDETTGLSDLGAASAFTPDVELALTAAPSAVQILPGTPTRVWTYSGRVVKGPPGTLQSLPGSYLGPIIRLQTGQKVRIHFTNQLPERTIVHWHGLHVPERMDGHPRFIIPTGQSYVYEFEVLNRAGTYWYHPHHHDSDRPTGVQRPRRTPARVRWRRKPRWACRRDRRRSSASFRTERSTQTISSSTSSGTPMDSMSGFLGDRVLVNGQAQPSLSLATRAYRFRLLNGSNSRVYKLAWSDGTPMTVIGTDGGLLEQPLAAAVPDAGPRRARRRHPRPQPTSRRHESPAPEPGVSGAPFEMGMGMGMGMGAGGGGMDGAAWGGRRQRRTARRSRF